MGTQFCGSTLWKHAPSRERLGRVAAVLGDAELEMLATNDVFWDEVVVDRAARGAGGLRRHRARRRTTSSPTGSPSTTSIEQDADMVILLHREDVYEKESPRAGEADIIVAKHRNGPTGDDHGRLPGPLLRFVDMAN